MTQMGSKLLGGLNDMRDVLFIANLDDDGSTESWAIRIDGREIITIRDDETDIADCALDPMWEALGITLEFVKP